jgi:hypothetical protein
MNFAAKVVCNGTFTKYDHVTPLLEKLNWNPVQQRFLIRKARYVFSSIHLPQSSAKTVDFFPSNTDSKKQNRRNDVSITYRSSDTGKKALSVSGALLWNNLPKHVKTSKSLKQFTENARNHFSSQL